MHYTRTFLRALSSALAGVAFGVVMVASEASAYQDILDCEPAVINQGTDINVAEIEQAINGTAADGPVYIVRSFESVPNADLDATLDQLIAACFAGDDGELAEDIVLLSVSVGDRLSAVEVGDRWGRYIPASEREWIRTEVMSAPFSEGNYTEGFVDGIVAADQLIGESVDAGAATTTTATTNADSDSAVEVRREPSDRTTVFAVVGALLLILLGAGVFAVINSRRKLAAARSSVEKALAQPRIKVGALRERFDRLVGQADVWERTTAGKTKAKLRTLTRESRDTSKDVERSAALLNGTIPNGVENATMAELRQARTAGISLSKSLEAHERELDRLTAFGAHLDHHRIALPTKKELLTEELVEIELLAASRQSQGWHTDKVRSTLISIEQGLAGVSFDDLELDLLSLSAYVEQAEADLFAAGHYLENLPNQVESLQAWDKELDTSADLELKRIDAARKELSVIANDHASSSWDWAVDNPEQALEELELAHQHQELAVSKQLPAQQFEEAGKTLERAGLHLMQADRLLDEVDDLLVDLAQAKIESPALLAQAEEILGDLTNFVAANAGELDSTFHNEPAEFTGALAGIRTELELERPNHLRVAETLDRINRRLDESLAGAKDAYARAQALRREADREVARADRTLRRAERALGWELIPSKDRRAVDQLWEALNDLPEDAQQRIIVAANIADGALQVQERIIARRRRRTAWATTGAGGGFGSGWSSGSGSQGSSWSRGGGRSTGGRSFSGGVSRGGRSFGGGRSSGSF